MKELKPKEKLDFHMAEINRHKKAIDDLGVFKKMYILPCKIPFKINYNYPNQCRECNGCTTTLVFYRSRLMCPKCAKRKWGKFTYIRQWQIL